MTYTVLRNRVHHRARGTIPDCKQPDNTSAILADRALGIRPGYDPLQAWRSYCDSEYGVGLDGEKRSYATFNPTMRD